MASLISAGTSTNTAVSITGDTTGALALATNNGTTAVTIDTSQNVGIGTASPTAVLDVRGAASIIKASNPQLFVSVDSALTTGSGYMQFNTANEFRIESYTSHPLVLGTANTERMRITSAGLVGIGQSSPASMLDVYGSTNATAAYTAGTSMPYLLRLFNSGSGVTGLTTGIQLQTRSGDQSGALWNIGAVAHSGGSYSNLVFQQQIASAYTEAARFDISGNFLVKKTANTASADNNVGALLSATGKCIFEVSGDRALILNRLNDNGIIQEFFRGAGNQVGNINAATSSVAYNTTSDYRLKDNIAPMTGALTKVQALKPVTYKWKVDGTDAQGFIAHELQAVVPDCVTGEKDAVDEDGKPVYQSIDTSFLVATLTAAIQELKVIVDAQAVEIAALKAKVGS